MTDQQVGSGHAGDRQQLAQLVGDLGGGARQLGPVTPPRPGPVVEHTRGEFGGSPLNDEAVHAGRAGPGQEHHRRTPLTRPVKEQFPVPDLVVPSHRGRHLGRLTLHR